MNAAELARLRTLLRQLRAMFDNSGPQLAAALLAVTVAVLLMAPRAQTLQTTLRLLWQNGAQGLERLGQLAAFPPVLLGLGLLLMAFGLVQRARLAWAVTLLLALLAAGLALWTVRHPNTVFMFAAALIVVLLVWARRFDAAASRPVRCSLCSESAAC